MIDELVVLGGQAIPVNPARLPAVSATMPRVNEQAVAGVQYNTGDHATPLTLETGYGAPVAETLLDLLILRTIVTGVVYLDRYAYAHLTKEVGFDKLGRIIRYRDGGLRWPGPWGWVTVKMADDLPLACANASRLVAEQNKNP